MDCANFAQQTAEAFNTLFNLGSVYGAVIFFAGVVVGYVAASVKSRRAA